MSLRRVRRTFGVVDQTRAADRDQRGLPLVHDLVQDVRFAFRLMARDRGFALTVCVVLGLGIGVNSMQFAVFDAHLLRGLPIPRPDRVLYISTFDDRQADRGVSYHDYEDLRRSLTTFDGLSAYTTGPVIVRDEGRSPERRDAARISANAFAHLGIQPVLGRTFVDDEDRSGATPVGILTRALWKSRYGGDPTVIGRAVRIDGNWTTIVGVVADRSGFPGSAEVFLPLAQTLGLEAQPRTTRTLRVFGRLARGVSPSQARAEVEATIDRLARQHPETSAGNRARVVPINERFLGRIQPVWYAFLAVGFLMAAISAANVANLTLARSVHRSREFAVRTSLGASRGRIARQLLIESAVLATLGGAAGLGLASAGLRLFSGYVPPGLLPYWWAYEMDFRAFAVLVAISMGALTIFGLLPAAYASRTDVNRVLKSGAGTGPRAGTRRWMSAFLTAEFALTVLMLSNLVLGLRAVGPALPTEHAVNTRDVLTAAMSLPPERYPGVDERAQFVRRLEERVTSIPGVTGVSFASHLPTSGAAERMLEVSGRAMNETDAPRVWSIDMTPGYLELFGLGVVRGRSLVADDGTPGRVNVLINERFAEQFFPGEDPFDRPIALVRPGALDEPRQWLTIVGVAPNIARSAGADADPIAYLPASASPPATMFLLIRSAAGADVLGPLVRKAVADLDPDLPIFRLRTMAAVVHETAWSGRISTVLVSMFTLVALTLAAVGLYAVVAHTVSLQSREIGVRMALGATRGRIWRMVVLSALTPVALALGLGALGTLAWDRTFETGARARISLSDPLSLLLVAAIMAAITVVACIVPARRATGTDPVTALHVD